MNKFDVFASEGGYRYAGAIHAGGPVMSCSPWFKMIEDAEEAAAKATAAEMEEGARRRLEYGIEVQP